MDAQSKNLIDDFIFRPQLDRTSNRNDDISSRRIFKSEMQMVRLSDESQQLVMETLRSIHGAKFELDDPSKYEDRGKGLKKSYWEDRGNLVVQSVETFKNQEDDTDTSSQLRRYGILKLKSYGYPLTHCIEAYDHCNGDLEASLLLLFRKYMHLPDTPEELNDLSSTQISSNDLLEMRRDEKGALESIFDSVFEEKEHDIVWCLTFRIDHLMLSHSLSARKRAKAKMALNGLASVASKSSSDDKKKTVRCRNFDRNGTCKYGQMCRFLHIRGETREEIELRHRASNSAANADDNLFFLEIRFPSDTRYPYEAPYIFLKSACHDIASDTILRLSRRLYLRAREICSEGIPCVFTISDNLQMDETLSDNIEKDATHFPDSDISLFHQPNDNAVKRNGIPLNLPSHYELGSTSHTSISQRSQTEIQKENQSLLRRYLERQNDDRYKRMLQVRSRLPAYTKISEILELIDNEQVVVISGETGCGKSTQVPQFILDQWLNKCAKLSKDDKLSNVEIVCTQPRRLSTIGVAERVADERTERVGQTIGYQIRLENKLSSSTRLLFCTTGILLRRVVTDPLLESVTHIIVDEVHERSEDSDFLLMVLKPILKERKDLKLILMSATLNAKLFSNYFGGAPVLDIPGRTYPVEQIFLEDILEKCSYVMEHDSIYTRKFLKKEFKQLMEEMEVADIKVEQESPPDKLKDETLTLTSLYARYKGYTKKTCDTIYLMDTMRVNPELIESVLQYIVEGEHNWPNNGSILVFLPGIQEIQQVYDQLCDHPIFGERANRFVLLPLHSTLTTEEQAAIFRPTNKRKLVLATNIAETSITIDDCVFVIDCGFMKEKHFDTNRNMESLVLGWVSVANAMQRKGRAGRVMPGVCIHLFTNHRFKHHLLKQPIPEIHRIPLEQLLLRIKTIPKLSKQSINDVLQQTLEPPSNESITSAIRRLQDVDALDEYENLTPLGHHLSALPVDVRVGKLMLFGAIFQCIDSVLTIAACLSVRSPFVSPFNKRNEAERCKKEFAICDSDHLASLLAYKKWLEVSKNGVAASRNYANEHFLSLNTLKTISDIKYQFLELLVSIGFVPINVPRKRKHADDNIMELTGTDMNINNNNYRLLVALLCGALYPNVVQVLTAAKSYVQTSSGALPKTNTTKDIKFKTRTDGYVFIHPSSVSHDLVAFSSPFLMFQEKIKTSCIYIRDCTVLPILALLLFSGSDMRIELHDGDYMFMLDNDWIALKAQTYSTAEMLHCIRLELFKVLEEKIREPCLNLLHHENGRKIIKAIIHLVTNNQ